MALPKSQVIGFLTIFLLVVVIGIIAGIYVHQSDNLFRKSTAINEVLLRTGELRSAVIHREGAHSSGEVNSKAVDPSPTFERGTMLNERLTKLREAVSSVPELEAEANDVGIHLSGYLAAESVVRGQDSTSNVKEIGENAQLEAVGLIETLEISLNGFEQLVRSLQSDLDRERRKNFYVTILSLGATVVLCLGLVLLLLRTTNLLHKSFQKNQKILSRRNTAIKDLFEQAPCGYLIVNSEGMITGTNQTLQTWLGYKKEDIVDRMHVSAIIPSWATAIMNLPSVSGNTPAGNSEMEVLKSNGTSVPALVSLSMSTNALRTYDTYKLTLVDYTEQKKLENHLRQDINDLEAFSYSVSHDLRAPLRAINSYSAILKEEYMQKVDGEGAKIIETILNNSLNMGQLITDLLKLSKTGRQEVVKNPVNMEAMVEHIIQEHKASQQTGNVAFVINLTEPALADIGLIRQVWVNLISNAVKYSMPIENPVVEIGDYPLGNETVFFVKDNGVGFDMAYYHKLFGVFQRLHAKRDFEGTGVGLSLVKRIIENHHGRIWAEAEVNKGATFHFTLPHANGSIPADSGLESTMRNHVGFSRLMDN